MAAVAVVAAAPSVVAITVVTAAEAAAVREAEAADTAAVEDMAAAATVAADTAAEDTVSFLLSIRLWCTHQQILNPTFCCINPFLTFTTHTYTRSHSLPTGGGGGYGGGGGGGQWGGGGGAW